MEFADSPRIFVVEDNLVYQALIAKELESVSKDIHFYTRGESCICDLDKKPTLLILDYNLEGEINGLDTLQLIREKTPEIPAILFSNQTNLNSTENLVRYGTFNYLEKRENSFSSLKAMIRFSLSN